MADTTNFEKQVETVLGFYDLGFPQNIRPLGGTATPKFAVELPTGRFVVRRRPDEFASEPMIRFDHIMLERLFQKGLPVPRPQINRDGRTWVLLDKSVYEVLSCVEGELFTQGDVTAIKDVGCFLANFHLVSITDYPLGKEGMLREDHPDLLMPLAVSLQSVCTTKDDKNKILKIMDEIQFLRTHLEQRVYHTLPKAVIHGDIHPGNLKFRNSKVSAVYDFDYLSSQARIRDVCDALVFFASDRNDILNVDDIYSLTQPFRINCDLATVLLKAYNKITKIEKVEFQALPLILHSQWIQIRLRGSRKVPDYEKIPFVLQDFFSMLDWIESATPGLFEKLEAQLAF
jgi:Ser/Thr protein kinase RdoA (MazF antagonist)